MPTEPITETLDATIYPTLSERVQSTFIDLIFIVFLMFMSSEILEMYENPPEWIRMVLFFSIWGVYEPLCTSLGFTIGNYVKDIRVRRMNATDERINIVRAFFRYVFKCCLGWISFLTISTNKERRAIHDMIAGSVMIRLEKKDAKV
jgi:uncharacterized RDD family membrane protein YckC